MAKILHIDTSTSTCSVALSNENKLLAVKSDNSNRVHSSMLTVFISEIFKKTGIKAKNLNAVSVSKGPGSYTGLRIGVAVAKGICFSLKIPLIGISTLKLMASAVYQKEKWKKEKHVFCPLIDARRMEVYFAIYDRNLFTVYPPAAQIVEKNTFDYVLANNKTVFLGDGVNKCKAILKEHKNAFFDESYKPSAVNLISLAIENFQNKTFENLSEFEPFYLKPFVAEHTEFKIKKILNMK